MKKNGKIELLRFVFALTVVIFHLNVDWYNHGLQLMYHGNMGVEFFFLVSGFLMARSIQQRIACPPPKKSQILVMKH